MRSPPTAARIDDTQVSWSPRTRPGGFTADLSWLSGGYVVRSLAYLGIAAVLARALGPAGYGQVALFMALAAAVGYLAGSWPFLAVPVLVAEGHPTRQVLVPGFRLAAVAALACAVVALPVGAALLAGSPVELALLAGYSIALIGLQGVYAAFQAHGRMAAIASTQAAERVVTLVALGVCAVAVSVGVREAEIALTVAAAVVCVAAFLPLRGSLDGGEGRAAEPVDARGILAAVGPMAIVTACSYLVAWIDLLILGAFVSDSDVGVYALAYQLFTFVAQLAALSIVAALPRHAQSAAAGVRDLARLVPVERLVPATRLWAGAVALAAAVGVLAAPPVFGSGFERSAGPLALLLAGAAFAAPYYALVPAVVALRRTRRLAWISLVAVVLNIGLDLALVAPFGVWGPAVATVVQALVSTAALTWWALGREQAQRLAVAALPAGLALVAVAAAGHGLAVTLAAAAVGAATVVAALMRPGPGGLSLPAR
jgi:O-antigen/teichoic acid export membrane protein